VIVAMGSTAALAVFGKTMPVMKSRRQVFQLDDQAQATVAVHPSYLLRIPDAHAKAAAFEDFVADLRFARELVSRAG
jgi:uracil-DNA glycosylase